MNVFLALLITFAAALAWLRVNNFTAQRGWVSSHVSRKVIHIGTGPLFVLCWLLFPEIPSARFLAALVPLAITAQFVLVGAGLLRDPAAVQAMSRTGERRELLRGPLYYGIVFVALTLIYWKDSPVGIVALMLLCGGDGLADLVGRRFGQVRLPWNPAKTWAGSTGMYLGGWLFSFGVLAAFVAAGVFPGPLWVYFPAVTAMSVAGTLVESLPTRELDNLTVPAAAVLIGHLIMPGL